MKEQNRGFEIVPRPAVLGGGWKLILWEDGQEIGSGVFPLPKESSVIGMNWWNSMTQQERGYWITRSASAVPADARRAYLLAEAYEDAREQGESWIR